MAPVASTTSRVAPVETAGVCLWCDAAVRLLFLSMFLCPLPPLPFSLAPRPNWFHEPVRAHGGKVRWGVQGVSGEGAHLVAAPYFLDIAVHRRRTPPPFAGREWRCDLYGWMDGWMVGWDGWSVVVFRFSYFDFYFFFSFFSS